MTETAQRIAIAEACGWTNIKHVDGFGLIGKHEWQGIHPENVQVPNYLHDLNAMHEAEKVLTAEQRRNYVLELATHGAFDTHSICFAAAAQRAEAFLCTIGKLKDK